MSKEGDRQMDEAEFLKKWVESLRTMAQHFAYDDAVGMVQIVDELLTIAYEIYHISRKDPHDPDSITEKVREAISLCRDIEDRLNSILSREEAYELVKNEEESWESIIHHKNKRQPKDEIDSFFIHSGNEAEDK